MSKDELKKKRAIIKCTRAMIKESAACMNKRIEKAFLSGGINLDDFEDDNHLPRIIFNALMREEINQYKPITKDDQKVADNLYLSM
jgi:hypothetical protein